jgi:hypothetical protein
MDKIIFSPFSIFVYVLRVLLHVHVKLILREWPSIPAIKVKQKRSTQMDWSIRLNYSPGWFLEKGYLMRQVAQPSLKRNKLMLYHRIKIKPLYGELNVQIVWYYTMQV